MSCIIDMPECLIPEKSPSQCLVLTKIITKVFIGCLYDFAYELQNILKDVKSFRLKFD